MSPQFVSADELRTRFSTGMSRMYRDEVPAYGTLLDIVETVNEQAPDAPVETASAGRLSVERHGAIRLGTARELFDMRRMFALLGMEAVGYYDLSVAGIPVHSTAFRPTSPHALARNPFRVFTSLLRLDLIASDELRAKAQSLLQARSIFTPLALDLCSRAEQIGGLTADEADVFVAEFTKTFQWHAQAPVTAALYEELLASHRLTADIVSFKGPHINHLTPRTLDIEAVQAQMPEHGIAPKAVIEGPPARQCPILLRQTSFKAIVEPVLFADGESGQHLARFGEIEQRGAALTPKGRALYDRLLDAVRADILPAGDGSNADEYRARLEAGFAAFPDDWETLRREGLAYFQYALTPEGQAAALSGGECDLDIDTLIARGLVAATPQTYEDFLPVSAAGIFASNLGDGDAAINAERSNQEAFETALGAPIADPFALYATLEARSQAECLEAFQAQAVAE
ncbi:MAG: VOC family protein [Alphaproteobacteria bacterium]|nr:VOC family protein [Alphaproteobacteria bacterium]